MMVVLFALPTSAPALSPCAPGEPRASCRGAVVPFGSLSSSVRALPIFVFSFTCHQNVVSISNELDRPTPRRVLKLVASAIVIAAAAYLMIAGSGYSTFGDQVSLRVQPNLAFTRYC